MLNAQPDIELIRDASDNIANAIMQGPPKDEQRFEKERLTEADNAEASD